MTFSQDLCFAYSIGEELLGHAKRRSAVLLWQFPARGKLVPGQFSQLSGTLMLFSALGSHHKASLALTQATHEQLSLQSPADGGGFTLRPPKKHHTGARIMLIFFFPSL